MGATRRVHVFCCLTTSRRVLAWPHRLASAAKAWVRVAASRDRRQRRFWGAFTTFFFSPRKLLVALTRVEDVPSVAFMQLGPCEGAGVRFARV